MFVVCCCFLVYPSCLHNSHPPPPPSRIPSLPPLPPLPQPLTNGSPTKRADKSLHSLHTPPSHLISSSLKEYPHEFRLPLTPPPPLPSAIRYESELPLFCTLYCLSSGALTVTNTKSNSTSNNPTSPFNTIGPALPSLLTSPPPPPAAHAVLSASSLLFLTFF